MGAQKDLHAGILRQVNSLSLSEDSVRLLRAPRLMRQFELEVRPISRVRRLNDWQTLFVFARLNVHTTSFGGC